MQKKAKKEEIQHLQYQYIAINRGGNKVLCIECSFASLSQNRRNANRQDGQSQAKKQRKSEWQMHFLMRFP